MCPTFQAAEKEAALAQQEEQQAEHRKRARAEKKALKKKKKARGAEKRKADEDDEKEWGDDEEGRDFGNSIVEHLNLPENLHKNSTKDFFLEPFENVTLPATAGLCALCRYCPAQGPGPRSPHAALWPPPLCVVPSSPHAGSRARALPVSAPRVDGPVSP